MAITYIDSITVNPLYFNNTVQVFISIQISLLLLQMFCNLIAQKFGKKNLERGKVIIIILEYSDFQYLSLLFNKESE